MSFFSKLSVDSIIADIEAKIERLHVVAEIKREEAKVHDAIIAERNKLRQLASDEANCAKAIAEKFAELVRF